MEDKVQYTGFVGLSRISNAEDNAAPTDYFNNNLDTNSCKSVKAQTSNNMIKFSQSKP